MAFVIGTEIVPLLDDANVAVTTPTTPLPIAVAFMPLARQVTDPLAEAQFRVLFAAVRDGPAATVSDVMALAAYESVHCKPAGVLVEVFNERFNESEPPGTTDPEPKLKD